MGTLNYFDRTLAIIDSNLTKEHNCIPFGMPKLEQQIPGITKATYSLFTASSGVGKSTVCNSMFVYNPYEFVLAHPEIKLKIFYFSMEISLTEMLIKGIIRNIYRKYNIVIDEQKIKSLNQYRMSQEEYDMIIEQREYFERLEDVLVIEEDSINPYGIYKKVEEYMLSVGKMENGVYVPNQEEFVEVIMDHVSLLNTEKGMDLRETIEKSSKDMVRLRNKYGVSPLAIQQQVLEKSKAQYTNAGVKVEDKHEPSTDGLADGKSTIRDVNVAYSLYKPQEFGITKHNGINIVPYGDYYRSLRVIKNRNGKSGFYLPLNFNGEVGVVTEL